MMPLAALEQAVSAAEVRGGPWSEVEALSELILYARLRHACGVDMPSQRRSAKRWTRGWRWVQRQYTQVETLPPGTTRVSGWVGGHPAGDSVSPALASAILTTVHAKMPKLHRQVRELVRRGWSRDDIIGECLVWCVHKMETRARYDPKRGDLGAWVWSVCRSRLGHLLDRTPQPTTAGVDVAERQWQTDGALPRVEWGARPADYQWETARSRRDKRKRGEG